MRWILVALVAAALAGCDSSDKPATDAPASSGSAAETAQPAAVGLKGLKVVLDGKELTMQTAIAYSEGGSGLEIVFSTATPKCDDFKGNGRMLADGEKAFTVSVAPLLGKDGKVSWGIGKVYFSSNTKQGGDLGKVTIKSADAAKGVTGELDFALVVEKSDFLKRPEQKLTVKGPFSAKGCGVFTNKGGDAPPPARAQKDVKLTVAGKRFDIVGATVRPTDFPKPGHELMLSTAPVSCDDGPDGEDMQFKANVSPESVVTFVYMAGSMFPSQLNASFMDPDLTATPSGDWGGEGELEISLKGKADVVGYPLEADGKVTALRCPAKK